MPAIDLARLRKQANRLADFFFLPDEFLKHLREMLEFYVNHTLRTKENVAPGSNLKTYRTPSAVLTQIENELRAVAEANPEFALELADILWDEGSLETHLLAAFLLGRIPPQEERLLPRLTAWTQQVRDADVRSALLSTSLTRMRKETPGQFFNLIREYLHPARMRTWSNGIQALIPMIADTDNTNLPPIFDMVEPIIEEAPSTLQNDLTDLIVALYRASSNETIFLLKHILTTTENQMTVVTMRRIAPSFPPPLQTELRELLRAKPLSAPKIESAEDIDDFIVDEIYKPKEESASIDKKTITRRKKKTEMDYSRVIYLHGLESSSQSGKARQFAEKFPGMVTPDFTGEFEERMAQLKPILGRKKNWVIIGSSFGGLMGTVFTCKHPSQVRKLILLAPALLRDPFGSYLNLETVSVPTVIVHGTEDDVVPLEPVRELAEKLFTNLTYHVVNDGHRLHKAFEELNWEEILA
ncbi:MAG: alpha/beta fold hydrolase [Anaerolineales bacterium]|uniref:alpha/beta fold hydrolase n=1 Tax=Candidatus Villigracilis proximus TaxID=3140683 RepID=UPI003136737A|nr:alpha/beta fold hydrolase [Anaerolineales bacterium]